MIELTTGGAGFKRRADFLPFSILVLLLLATLAVGQEPATPPSGWTPEESMKVKRVDNVQVSPDGRRVVFTVTEPIMTADKSEYLTHIHLANADGSDPRQLTYGDKSCTSPQWSPDGRWIAFTSERLGKNNIWLLRTDGGEAQPLTDGKTSVLTFRWSPDSKQIVFTLPDSLTAKEEKDQKGKDDARVVDENFKMYRLWVIPTEKDAAGKRPARVLTPGDLTVGITAVGPTLRPFINVFDWSPDGKAIVFAHAPTPRADDWLLFDISSVEVATGTITPLASTGACETMPLYSPDGRWIAYMVSDDPPTRASTFDVAVVAAKGGAQRLLAKTFDRLSTLSGSSLIGWSADSQHLYFTETRGTITKLSALPVDGNPPQDLDRGEGVILGLNLSSSRTAVGFTLQTTTRPPEAFASRLDRFAPVQVSRVNADLPIYPLGRTEVIRYKATDGLEIEGLLIYPVGYEPGKRYPLLLLIHGGPAAAYTQTFIANLTYPMAVFAAQGYAVLRCNIRGSAGYGKPFRYANYQDFGGMDYQDLMAGVDHVIVMGVADGDRLGVMGWSYGGYMTAWIISQTSRFKAASVGAGITNLISMAGTSDMRGLADWFGAEFWDNPDLYLARSPIFHIKGVSTPTLIQHGEQDARVPISQGYELYNALKRQGCPVQMVVYPRAPHGPQEPKQVLDVTKRNVAWFDRYLRQEEVNKQ